MQSLSQRHARHANPRLIPADGLYAQAASRGKGRIGAGFGVVPFSVDAGVLRCLSEGLHYLGGALLQAHTQSGHLGPGLLLADHYYEGWKIETAYDEPWTHRLTCWDQTLSFAVSLPTFVLFTELLLLQIFLATDVHIP